MPSYRPLSERFHEKYQPVPFSGCWIWEAATDRKGYGQIGIEDQKHKSAHRVSWELHNGNIPEGKHILHRCDVPSCVNPAHLFLGTHKENMRDSAVKNRNNPKLNVEAVADIRTRRMTQHEFARLYGVSRSAVRNVLLGINWKER